MADEGKSGNPGGGDGGDAGKDHAAELATLREQVSKLEAALAGKKDAGGKKSDESEDDDDDSDLAARAGRSRADRNRDSLRTKQLEAAIDFKHKSVDFLEKNKDILPPEAADVFAQADKENFADAIEKDQELKAGLIKVFFDQKSNVELLTPGQKAMLDGFNNLTKTGKQEKAQEIYELVFEPAFAMVKQVKKAQALNKGDKGGSKDFLTQKYIDRAQKRYWGEKHGA